MALACAGTGCPDTPVVQWQRRPTPDELDAAVSAEEARRDQIRAATDPTDPPVFGPLPTAADTTIAVYACAIHAITMDLATVIHESTCTAPNNANLPGCTCTPEPLQPDPMRAKVAAVRLPEHWQ
jgi:hypothetical protein